MTVLSNLRQPAEFKIVDLLMRSVALLVEPLAALLIVVETVVLAVGVFARYVMHSPLVWTDELASTLFLWLIMLGSVIALQRGEHMRLGFFASMLSPRQRSLCTALVFAAIVVSLALLLLPAYERFEDEAMQLSPVLEVSKGWHAAALAVGIVLMFLSSVSMVIRECRLRDIGAALVIIGSVACLFWLALPFLLIHKTLSLILFFIVLLGACIFLSIPIAFSFVLATSTYLLVSTRVPLVVVVGRLDEGASSTILLSVPLFILLGYLIEMTGMAKAMVDFLAALLGHVRGGLNYVLLSGMYLVSGISGSKAADIAAIAPVLLPEMKRRNAKPDELIGLISSSAAMAETIPPSLVLIALGSVAGVSIASLFAAGFLPALFLAVLLALLARYRSRNEDMSGVRRAPALQVRRTFFFALPALILPFLVRVFVAEGVTTATEVSTVAIIYVLTLGLAFYRRFDFRRLYSILVATASLSGAILLIVGAASAMAWALTQSGFSRDIVAAVVAIPGGTASFLLASIFLFLILGSILEGLPALILFAPLLFPAARAIGIHDVHYAMVIILAMGAGLFSPPLGVGFYIACAIGKVNPDHAMRSIWFYMLVLLAGLFVIAFVPWLSLVFI